MNPCLSCESLCCRYISIPIGQPRDRGDCELIRWYLAHQGVCVYINPEGDWLVHVDTTCRHLESHRCMIYPRRSKICREYESRSCETADHEEENIAEFHSAEEFERFRRRNFRYLGSRLRRRHRSWRT